MEAEEGSMHLFFNSTLIVTLAFVEFYLVQQKGRVLLLPLFQLCRPRCLRRQHPSFRHFLRPLFVYIKDLPKDTFLEGRMHNSSCIALFAAP